MAEYERYCIGRELCIREAMERLNDAEKKVLFVVGNKELIASLTDGDIRRYMLSGGVMDDNVMAAANACPQSATDRAGAANVLRLRDCTAVPIVDENNTVKDIVFAGDSAKKITRFCAPVVIVAGGRGTRLDPYTRVLPKPLIPIGDLPIIEHIMRQFTQYGCNEFHIIVNHKKELIKAYFADADNSFDITWYEEEKPLGTGGGLSMLAGVLRETFVLTNCDILLTADIGDAYRYHRLHTNDVTMVCAQKDVTIPYGVIEVGDNGEILAMKEKPSFSFQTNTGMYFVEPEVLMDIEPDVAIGFPDVVDARRRKGHRVAAYLIGEENWLDMGQPFELEQMRKRLYGDG